MGGSPSSYCGANTHFADGKCIAVEPPKGTSYCGAHTHFANGKCTAGDPRKMALGAAGSVTGRSEAKEACIAKFGSGATLATFDQSINSAILNSGHQCQDMWFADAFGYSGTSGDPNCNTSGAPRAANPPGNANPVPASCLFLLPRSPKK